MRIISENDKSKIDKLSTDFYQAYKDNARTDLAVAKMDEIAGTSAVVNLPDDMSWNNSLFASSKLWDDDAFGAAAVAFDASLLLAAAAAGVFSALDEACCDDSEGFVVAFCGAEDFAASLAVGSEGVSAPRSSMVWCWWVI